MWQVEKLFPDTVFHKVLYWIDYCFYYTQIIFLISTMYLLKQIHVSSALSWWNADYVTCFTKKNTGKSLSYQNVHLFVNKYVYFENLNVSSTLVILIWNNIASYWHVFPPLISLICYLLVNFPLVRLTGSFTSPFPIMISRSNLKLKTADCVDFNT